MPYDCEAIRYFGLHLVRTSKQESPFSFLPSSDHCHFDDLKLFAFQRLNKSKADFTLIASFSPETFGQIQKDLAL